MTIERFEELVNEGIKAIPKEFLAKLDNVDIVIENEPTSEQLLGLYEGIPKTKRWGYGQVLPDKITIFKNPIEKIAQSEQKVKRLVRDIIWHEIAHHFGMDEKEVRKVESRRRKT